MRPDSSVVPSNMRRSNGYKQNYRNSSAEYEEKHFFPHMTEHWARLSREEVESLALGIF